MKKTLIILAALTFAGSVHAGPMTYNYLSDPLSAESGLPAVTNVTATFTADLAANLSSSVVTSLITNWSISDGATSLDQSSSDYTLVEVIVFTDALGTISSVEFLARWSPLPPANPLPGGTNFAQFFSHGGGFGNDIALTQYCTTVNTSTGQCADLNQAVANSGVLTAAAVPEPTPVPEPSTLGLLGAGLFGLGFIRRRRAA